MLNDPQVLEASRVFAQNLLSSEAGNDDRISIAFRSIICRRPSQEEVELLSNYHEVLKNEFSIDPEKSEVFVEVGEYPLESDNKVELAALMQLIHTIYNMEEAITKS